MENSCFWTKRTPVEIRTMLLETKNYKKQKSLEQVLLWYLLREDGPVNSFLSCSPHPPELSDNAFLLCKLLRLWDFSMAMQASLHMLPSLSLQRLCPWKHCDRFSSSSMQLWSIQSYWKPSPAMLHFVAPLYNKIIGKLVHGDSLSPLVSLEVNSSRFLSSLSLTSTGWNAMHPPRYVHHTICQQHPFTFHDMVSFLGFFCCFTLSVIESHIYAMSLPCESLRFSNMTCPSFILLPNPDVPIPASWAPEEFVMILSCPLCLQFFLLLMLSRKPPVIKPLLILWYQSYFAFTL